MKKIILIIILVWGILIFVASSQNWKESNEKSKRLIYPITKHVLKITNYWKITNIDISNEKEINKIVNKLNYPIRKIAHIFLYFVLSILLMLVLTNCKLIPIKKMIIVVILCFLYSITDEYHQTLISGRTGKITDCIIDTIGAVMGTTLFIQIEKIKIAKKGEKK